MVVDTSLWPSNSCTDTGLQIPACTTARLIAHCKRSSNKWCLRSTPLRGSIDSVGEGNTQNQAHDRPTCGYFISNAWGVSTPPRWALRSASHCSRATRTCARNAWAKERGNITTRSLLPLASRTMITWRSKSMSLIRRRSCVRNILRKFVLRNKVKKYEPI